MNRVLSCIYVVNVVKCVHPTQWIAWLNENVPRMNVIFKNRHIVAMKNQTQVHEFTFPEGLTTLHSSHVKTMLNCATNNLPLEKRNLYNFQRIKTSSSRKMLHFKLIRQRISRKTFFKMIIAFIRHERTEKEWREAKYFNRFIIYESELWRWRRNMNSFSIFMAVANGATYFYLDWASKWVRERERARRKKTFICATSLKSLNL